MYKTIIVPIDLAHAERGKDMIGLAGKLADKGARTLLVNVVEDVPTYVAAELPSGLIEKSKKDAHRKLEKMVKAAGVNAEVQVRTGSPATAILASAEETGADLIIIASHRPGLSDYLLGSTAARVVRHAMCSVLVAR